MMIEILIKGKNENFIKSEFNGTIDEIAVWVAELIRTVKETWNTGENNATPQNRI